MAVYNIGRVAYVNKGAYNAATVYKKYDVVLYQNGSYAYVNDTSAAGNVPTNATYWTVMLDPTDVNLATTAANDAAQNALDGIIASASVSGDDLLFTTADSTVHTATGAMADVNLATTAANDAAQNALDGIIASASVSGDDLLFTTADSTVHTATGAMADVNLATTAANDAAQNALDGIIASASVSGDDLLFTTADSTVHTATGAMADVNLATTAAASAAQLAAGGPAGTYADNIVRDTFFITDPLTTGLVGSWCDRNILLLGDSHGWGEGSPNFQGASSGYTIHAPWIHNKSFYGRLMDYFYQKFDSEPWRVIPLFDKANFNGPGGGTPSALTAANNPSYIDRMTFTRTPRIVKGKFFIDKTTKSAYITDPPKDAMAVWMNAETREDTYSQAAYSHNADIGLFGAGRLVFAPNAGESCICFDMDKPSRYAIIQLSSGYETFAKCKIELLDDSDFNNDGTPNDEQTVTGFGNAIYGTATPTVHVLDAYEIDAAFATPPNAVVNASDITIDTSNSWMNYEAVYVIDFHQKKKGTLRLSHAGNGISTTGSDATLSSSIVVTRGVLFSNRDLVKNWSMGGHTVGAWLGSQSNWNGSETHDHLTDMMAYMTGGIKGAIIEAPIVNEVIKQTAIATFKGYLDTLLTRIKTDNVIIFPTLGEKDHEFESGTATIDYDDYALAVEEWAADTGGNVTFVDIRKYIKGLVDNGTIHDYNDLYINGAHPSPMFHELVFDMLVKLVDIKF